MPRAVDLGCNGQDMSCPYATAARTWMISALELCGCYCRCPRRSRALRWHRRMLREALMSMGAPMPAAMTEASKSPPCAAMPGISKGKSGATLRTCSSLLGYVAPVTRPQFPFLFQVCAAFATARKSGSPESMRMSWNSPAPGLDVRQSTKTPVLCAAEEGIQALRPQDRDVRLWHRSPECRRRLARIGRW